MEKSLGETYVFTFTTAIPATGEASNADSLPTWKIFEDAETVAIQTGTATLRSGETGVYYGSVVVSAANGFETGKTYPVTAFATVDGVVGNAVIDELIVRPSVAITPLSSTVSAGAVTTNELLVYQHAAYGPFVWVITDDDGAAIDLSAKIVSYVAFAPEDEDTTLYTFTTTAGDIVVSGAGSNTVTLSADDTNTATAGMFAYRLVNTTDDQVLNTGSVEVVAGPTV